MLHNIISLAASGIFILNVKCLEIVDSVMHMPCRIETKTFIRLIPKMINGTVTFKAYIYILKYRIELGEVLFIHDEQIN